VGVGAYWAGIYHLMTHAVFKALLFLGSGSVILGCHHNQDMRKMGGLKKFMPKTHWTYFFACIAITTAPFFFLSNGFFSKDEILWKAFAANHLLVPGWTIWLLGFVAAGLTAFYMWRSYYMTFTGEYRGDTSHGDPHESPRSMSWVLVTLACLILPTAALGFWPLIDVEPLFEQWLHPVVGAASASLIWLSQGDAVAFGLSVHALQVVMAAASVAISLAGWFAARILYKDARSKIPDKLLGSPSPLLAGTHRLIFNKYYVDELYDWLVVRRARQLAHAFFVFDQRVIDALVDFVGLVGRIIAAIDGMIDTLLVDGAVNGLAHGTAAIGRRLRRLQTGQIQTYLAGIVVGALMLVVISFLLSV